MAEKSKFKKVMEFLLTPVPLGFMSMEEAKEYHKMIRGEPKQEVHLHQHNTKNVKVIQIIKVFQDGTKEIKTITPEEYLDYEEEDKEDW